MTAMTEKTETATVQGRIIRALGGFYYIDTPEGLVECRARGVFRKEGVTPYVGGLARAELTGEGKGYLIELLPRKNFLIRPPVANIDLLVLNPVDYREIEPALREAQKAGVPVVVIDSQVSNPDLAACTIASDNYGAGVLCAEHLMNTRDSAKVVLLEHASTKSGRDRIQGFCDTLASDVNYQIIGRADSAGQLEVAMPEMDKLLEQGIVPDAVMSLNDPSALGAMAALQEHGMLQDTAVYGVDGAPEAKSMMSEGAMTATAAQSPIRLGQITAQTVYAILNGEDYEKEITVPVALVTRDNVNSYDMDGWQ